MPDKDVRPYPTMIPPIDFERIQNGDQQALADALRVIVQTVNAYILRKGG